MSNQVYGKLEHTSTYAADPTAFSVQRSALFWPLLIGFALFFIWAPFQQALFNGQQPNFEIAIFWAIIWVSVLAIFASLVYYNSLKQYWANLNAQNVTALLVWILPISYLISWLGAVSHYLAADSALIYSGLALFFTLGLFLNQNDRIARMTQNIIFATLYLLVLFGFLNWFGNSSSAGKLVGWFSNSTADGIYRDAVMGDATGLRLTSVFQYANTYAALLMALIFVGLYITGTAKKGHAAWIHGFMLVPLFTSIALTLSRGGLIVLPVVFFVMLLLLKPAQQLLAIIHSVIALLATVAILAPVSEVGLGHKPSWLGWILLLSSSLICMALIGLSFKYLKPWLEKRLEPWARIKTSNLWLPFALVIGGGILIFLFIGTGMRNVLPDNIRTRIESISFEQNSVLERFTFYKDSLKMTADYPTIGAGGGAWATLYTKYQNNPYISNQTHNYFLQYLDETGIIGFGLLFVFLIYVFYNYLRSYFKSSDNHTTHFVYFLIAFSILMHSLLDFNMSYFYISILVFFSLGAMAARINPRRFVSKPEKKDDAEHPNGSGPALIHSGGLILVAIMLIVVSGRYATAANASIKSSEFLNNGGQISYEDARVLLDKSLKMRSDYPFPSTQLASILQSVYSQTNDASYLQEARTILEDAYRKEPFNKSIINQLVAVYQAQNDNAKAFDLAYASTNKFKWDMNWYQTVLSMANQYGVQALNQGDVELKTSYFERGLQLYDRMKAGVLHLNSLPEAQQQGQPFLISPVIALDAAQIAYSSNKTDKAAEILKSVLTDDYQDSTNQQIAQWYLAALKKLGQSDQEVYDKLIKVDPSSKEQIDNLASFTF